jgi:hypothetical protein
MPSSAPAPAETAASGEITPSARGTPDDSKKRSPGIFSARRTSPSRSTALPPKLELKGDAEQSSEPLLGETSNRPSFRPWRPLSQRGRSRSSKRGQLSERSYEAKVKEGVRRKVEERAQASTKIQAIVRGRSARVDPCAAAAGQPPQWSSPGAGGPRHKAFFNLNDDLVPQTLKAWATHDPWLPKWIARAIEGRLESADHVNRDRVELEQHVNQDQKGWPRPPCTCRSLGLSWVRARYLYAVSPADRSLSYQVLHAPWMFLVRLTLFCPPVFPLFELSIISWWVYFLLVLCSVSDEYQLFNFIATFKTYAFVMVGLAAIFGDFWWEFLSDSGEVSGEVHMDGGTWIPRGSLHSEASAAAHAKLVSNRAFFLFFIPCWAVYLKYRLVRWGHARDARLGRPRRTGAVVQNTNDAEQVLLMLYDVVVVLAHAAFAYANLYLRIHSDVLQALQAPTQRTMLVESYLVTSLALFGAPFVLWKLPGGALFHRMRRTAYDGAGRLRLQMGLVETRRNYETREKQEAKKRREAKGACGLVAPSRKQVTLYLPADGTQSGGAEPPEYKA